MTTHSPSRRAFMRLSPAAAAAGAKPAKISSVLALVKPECCAHAAAAIAAMPGVDIHWQADNNSKLALLLETESDAATLQRLQDITATPGVITADLTYAYTEDSI